jgi:glutamine amidotransferase
MRLPDGDGGPGSVRIPNVGWRRLEPAAADPIMDGPVGKDGALVYFSHSFAALTDDPKHTVATIEVNGSAVAAIVRRDHILGYQFHPEKSGPRGMDLLRGFLAMSAATGVNR